jgi:hypothetical protein
MKQTCFCALLSFIFFFSIIMNYAQLPLPQRADPLQREKKQEIFAIKNVNIIPMTQGGVVQQNATAIVKNERIEAINGAIPNEAKIIDGTGKWLMPGLMDMHVHVPTDVGPMGPKLPTQGATMFFDLQDYMTLNNANGVTTVFDLGSRVEHFGQRNEIAKGSVIGPRMALAAMIDGGKGRGRRANTPDEGRQVVRSAKAEGYEFIKLYSDLNVETFQAIVDEAKKQDLKTVGHIPDAFQGKLKEAFVPHFGMVAHAEEVAKHAKDYSEDEAQRFAKFMKDNGTWLAPGLITMVWIARQVRSLDELRASPTLQYVHPLLQSKWLTANNYNKMSNPETIDKFDKFVKFHVLLVKACKAAGVPMVVGTDVGLSGIAAGFAVHDEMSLLVEAGLTPEEALTSATRLSATWLGIESIVGTVEIGKRADLILLDANPLIDIKNTRKIAGVFINGQWLEKATINATLIDLSKRNTAAKDKFDWKKMMGGK